MQNLNSASRDFELIQKVLVESLRLTGYIVESASMRIEPVGEKLIVNMLFVIGGE